MSQWRRAAALALVAAASCSGDPLAPEKDQLARAEELWAGAGFASYDFAVRVSCFCATTAFGTVVISVRNHQPVSVVRTDSGTTVDTLYFQELLTVDRMFATTNRFLAGRPDTFHATYDSNLGFPTEVSVDGNTRIADDEFGFTVLGLQAFLPP